MIFALDESGDLGWKFDLPYRAGGSSRYLSIGCVSFPIDSQKTVGRWIKQRYRALKWDAKSELKWADLSPKSRLDTARSLQSLLEKHPEIKIHAIVVNKTAVLPHIQADANKLYSFMVRMLLINRMAEHNLAVLRPDIRTIKIESMNSMSDYIQTELWFDLGVMTKLKTEPKESRTNKEIQFADFVSGIVQAHFEDRKTQPYEQIEGLIELRKLFF